MRSIHPALDTMQMARWDTALGRLLTLSVAAIGGDRLKPIGIAAGDRDAAQAEIGLLIEYLFELGIPQAGRLALAWQMLTVDPRKPFSLVCVLPQVQHALDVSDDLDERSEAALRNRIGIWWRAGEGEWIGSEVSIFRIADVETSGTWYGGDPEADDQPAYPIPMKPGTARKLIKPSGPSLVVMPAAKATKLNSFHSQYKEIVDVPLPLVVARDVASIRAALHSEFPHATGAIDLLIRDLREGQPVRLTPAVEISAKRWYRNWYSFEYQIYPNSLNRHLQRMRADDALDGLPYFSLHLARVMGNFLETHVSPVASSLVLAHTLPQTADEAAPITRTYYLTSQRMAEKSTAMAAWSEALIESLVKAGEKLPKPVEGPRPSKLKPRAA